MIVSPDPNDVFHELIKAHPWLIEEPEELAKRSYEIMEFYWDEGFVVECRRAKNITRKTHNIMQKHLDKKGFFDPEVDK